MRCVLCHCEKNSRLFPAGSPICRRCIDRLRTDYDVDYAPPEKVTQLEGFIRLLKASRKQAIEDEALPEWESVFLESPRWKMVWTLLKESVLY